MADRKISDLTALTTPASGDYVPIVDISEVAAASKNKRITIEELMRGMPNGTAAAPGIAFEADPNTGIYSPGADQLAVATNGTGRLFITSAGSVGIGTTSPNTLLTVGAGNTTPGVAKVIFNTGDVAATPGLVISNWIGSATTNGPRIAFDNSTRGVFEIGGANGTHAFVIVDQQVNTERLRITSAGLVGIGTSSPSTRLTVTANSSTLVPGLFFNTNNNFDTDPTVTQTVLSLTRDGKDGAAFPSSVDFGISRYENSGTLARTQMDIRLTHGGTGTPEATVMSLRSSGNVGIGTTAPSAKLHVETIPQAVSQSGSVIFGPDINYGLEIRNVIDASGYPHVEFRAPVAGAGPMLFFAGGATERARIDSSGRLLVGTSSDSGGALLQVNGDRIRVGTAKTPATSGATGAAGEIAWDADYIYVCTATNTWKRSAISTW